MKFTVTRANFKPSHTVILLKVLRDRNICFDTEYFCNAIYGSHYKFRAKPQRK